MKKNKTKTKEMERKNRIIRATFGIVLIFISVASWIAIHLIEYTKYYINSNKVNKVIVLVTLTIVIIAIIIALYHFIGRILLVVIK